MNKNHDIKNFTVKLIKKCIIPRNPRKKVIKLKYKLYNLQTKLIYTNNIMLRCDVGIQELSRWS